MGIAALIAWILTAGGGAVMLAKWVGGGGHRASTRSTLTPASVFGHGGLAGLGLVLWISYLITDHRALGWIALALLIPVVVLGFAMLRRWLSVFRGYSAGGQPSDVQDAPERSFPFPMVVGHGLLAIVTVVLTLLAVLQV